MRLRFDRGRIGKSELIKQVIKESDCKSIYYECKQTTQENNVDSLSEIIAEELDIHKTSFDNFENLLR